MNTVAKAGWGGWPHLLTFIRFANGRNIVSLEWHSLAAARGCERSVFNILSKEN